MGKFIEDNIASYEEYQFEKSCITYYIDYINNQFEFVERSAFVNSEKEYISEVENDKTSNLIYLKSIEI